MTKRLNWKPYNSIILKHQWHKIDSIYVLLLTEAKKRKDKHFEKNLTIQKVRWQIDNFYKTWKLNIKTKKEKKMENKNNINWLLLEFEIENIKKQKQNLYLKKNFREEWTISTVRDSIITSLDKKIENKSNLKIKNHQDLYTSKKEIKKPWLVLEHILTDIHLNEIVTRKKDFNNWSTEIGLQDIEKVINLIIDKQKWQYEAVSLLLLWDLVWTTIHEWLELDVEPIRASSYLASAISQSYFELKKHFKTVTITLVPWNHSETRKFWSKTDIFNENYDFIVWEKIKEFLSIFWEEENVFSPTRDLPIVVRTIWTEKHWYVHWDRFWNRLKSLLPMMEKYYKTHYLDYLHEWHFHTEKIRFEEDSLKFTYPCLCQPSTYGFNRIWVVTRERQLWNIYTVSWKLLETYSIDLEKDIPKSKFKVIFDIDSDLAEIFKTTITKIKENK